MKSTLSQLSILAAELQKAEKAREKARHDCNIVKQALGVMREASADKSEVAKLEEEVRMVADSS